VTNADATAAAAGVTDHRLRPGAHDLTRLEVQTLAGRGLDVRLVDPEPRYDLAADVQERVSRAIEERAGRSGFVDWLFDRDTHPSGAAWHGVAKRAIALHTLYNIGRHERPQDGLDAAVYDEPLFRDGAASARDLLHDERGQGAAERILARYDAFFSAPPTRDGTDDYGLTSYDYLLGVVDSHAVRTRADTAKAALREHFSGTPRAELRIVSVACGAAEAMYEFAAEASRRGTESVAIDLVDHDPLALATFAGLARTYGMGDRLRLHRKNFLKTPLDRVIAPGSVDVVDLIGVFEHLPTSRAGYRFAEHLLRHAAGILRPGGVIVLANMLPHRPQQAFFSSVWPPLQQRSIAQMLGILGRVGFDPRSIAVRVPGREGVYAVYLARLPAESGTVRTRPDTVQRALGSLILRSMPEL